MNANAQNKRKSRVTVERIAADEIKGMSVVLKELVVAFESPMRANVFVVEPDGSVPETCADVGIGMSNVDVSTNDGIVSVGSNVNVITPAHCFGSTNTNAPEPADDQPTH